MRKLFPRFMCVFLLLAFMLAGCGKVGDVQRSIDSSQLYSQLEIDKAMDIIVRDFRMNYDKCTLLELEYREDYNAERGSREAEVYGADKAIIIHGSFLTGDTNNAFEPNFTYNNYSWTLTRSGLSGWTLVSRGYG